MLTMGTSTWSTLTRRPMKRTSRSTGPAREVVDAILERAGFSCEICNHMIGDRRGIDWSVQHRLPRRAGGTSWPGINLPSNLGILCGSATTGCHGDVESNRAEALDSRWLLPSGSDPAMVPLLLRRERWTYLTDDAQYSDNPPVVTA